MNQIKKSIDERERENKRTTFVAWNGAFFDLTVVDGRFDMNETEFCSFETKNNDIDIDELNFMMIKKKTRFDLNNSKKN